MVPDAETKFKIGSVCCVIVFLHLLFNLIMIMLINTKEVNWAVKKNHLKKLQKQRLIEFSEKKAKEKAENEAKTVVIK